MRSLLPGSDRRGRDRAPYALTWDVQAELQRIEQLLRARGYPLAQASIALDRAGGVCIEMVLNRNLIDVERGRGFGLEDVTDSASYSALTFNDLFIGASLILTNNLSASAAAEW